MKNFIALTLAASVSAFNSQLENAFLGYITQYGKSYATMEEYKFRFEQFANTYQIIKNHKEEISTYTLGFN